MKRRHQPAGKVAKVSVGFLHPGHYSACFAESLTDLLFYDAVHHQRLMHPFGKIGKECGSSGIVDGRNKLAKTMCDESDAEWLFMVDSDMGFAADTVELLLEQADPVERPVVGALAFAHKTNGRSDFFGIKYKAQPTLYRFVDTDERVGVVPIFDYPRGELVPVDATGGACLLIHRSVFVTLREKYGDVWFNPITVPKGPTTFSEDLSFCLRLQLNGIPLFIDTSVKTTHDKGGVFLDEEYFDLQQARA